MHVLSELARIFYRQKDIRSVLLLPSSDPSVSVFLTNLAYPMKTYICLLNNGKIFSQFKNDLNQLTLGNYYIDQEKTLYAFLIRHPKNYDFVVVECNIQKEELFLLHGAKVLLIIRQGVIYDCAGCTDIPGV